VRVVPGSPRLFGGQRYAVSVGGILLGALVLQTGCLVYDVASAPVKIVVKTVEVAGKTTVAVVETTGKVAVSTVRATGSLASGGIEASSKLARAGMVTFADQASGSVVRVPWYRGLTLYGASSAAKLSVARSGIGIVRSGKLVYSASKRSSADLPLQSGDVVQLGS
jgi:hypothetical protein